MRQTALALAAILALAAPAQAQQEEPRSLQGLLDQMLGAVNPWLSDLAEKLGDLSGWHAPEVLPNGDILIRRRAGTQEPEVPPEAGSGETLEL